MRIAVFGTGAVGGYFGGLLAHAGEDVTFVARGAHLRAIRTEGLRVDTPEQAVVVRPAAVTDDVAALEGVDAILVAVKTWQVPAAAVALTRVMRPHTWAVPLQNGVEAAAQLASVLGARHVVGGVCGTLSRMMAP